MNLCDPAKYEEFVSWDGNSINLQHLKLERISKQFLKKLSMDEKME